MRFSFALILVCGLLMPITEAVCLNSSSCHFHGICSIPRHVNDTNSHCICDKGFVTRNCADDRECCLEQESRVLHFLIALFFNLFTGAQWFMVGDTLWGGMIVFCFWIAVIGMNCCSIGRKELFMFCWIMIVAIAFWIYSLVILAIETEPVKWEIAPW